MPQPSWQTFPTGSPNTLIVVDVVNPMVIWAAGAGSTRLSMMEPSCGPRTAATPGRS